VAILAPHSTEDWNSISLVDLALEKEADNYTLSRIKEAANDFSFNGFKSLAYGMRFQDLTVLYTTPENSHENSVRKIVIDNKYFASVGIYPLRYVACEFFKDRLYRIELKFDLNQKEIYSAFLMRFGPLSDGQSPTSVNTNTTAKSGGSDRCYGTILATRESNPRQEWNTIVLVDKVLQRMAWQHKADPSKKSAKGL
jgi:hypothetical protein